MKLRLAAITFALAFATAAAAAEPVLLPKPRSMTVETGALPLTGAFRVKATGCRQPLTGKAVARFQADVARLRTLGRGPGPALEIHCDAKDAGYLTSKAAEAYWLHVGGDGVRIEADGPAGALHGLATLRQLVGSGPGPAEIPYLRIDDEPRFPWRGVMIDTSRHFMSVATVKRQIDAMERVKLDVLHFHLSDNEGFRIESKRYPKLTQIATHGEFYTQAEIKDLVAYAADRGVRIVPEIDVPAHTAAILQAYPELAAQTDPAQPLAAANPALNPANEKTYAFLDGLLSEMTALFPDRNFHIGGDEVSDAAWMKDPTIVADMAANGIKSRVEMEAAFHKRAREILTRLGKTEIGWDEIAAAPLPKDVIVEVWRFSNPIADAVRAGHPTVVSSGYYLDHLETAATHYAVDPLDLQADGFTPAEVARAQTLNPLLANAARPLELKPLPPLTPDEQKLVLGGEGPIWAELVTDEMLDQRLWPRAGALAERFWSPREVRDPADMERRLAVVQRELETLGLQDLANRARMAERLAPGNARTVLTLLTAVSPTRNFAHNHTTLAMLKGVVHPPEQDLTSLADAAPTDAPEVWALEAGAARAAKGDFAEVSEMRAQLSAWAENDPAFAAIASGKPDLEAALPISAEVAAVARVGLAALDALQRRTPLPPDQAAHDAAILDQAEKEAAASARPLFVFVSPQPPADLIISITPAVRTLYAAATAR
ncbi:beta-N-acetylhexosaminidase [Phenylobacterium sp.]|uniref:beta-N-acetylhexosaminidase n=1 Tax=Phenylobacterium sp. TaxID=1871053 RepID=UPI002F4026EA